MQEESFADRIARHAAQAEADGVALTDEQLQRAARLLSGALTRPTQTNSRPAQVARPAAVAL